MVVGPLLSVIYFYCVSEEIRAAPVNTLNPQKSALIVEEFIKALSKIIHYGRFVAESKFRSSLTDDHEAAIKAKDREKLMDLLTFPAVEETIKKRVETKTKTFGQVGNAITVDYIGTFEYWWWTHSLISDSTYYSLQKSCEGSSSEQRPVECIRALGIAEMEQGHIDPGVM